jgi:hypothetical protein
MSESSSSEREQSNFHTDKNVRKKIRPWERKIPFKDLVRFASPSLADKFLAELADVDQRTARRWRRGQSRASADVMRGIVVNILSRVEL